VDAAYWFGKAQLVGTFAVSWSDGQLRFGQTVIPIVIDEPGRLLAFQPDTTIWIVYDSMWSYAGVAGQASGTLACSGGQS
jgi:hypothetical protein